MGIVNAVTTRDDKGNDHGHDGKFVKKHTEVPLAKVIELRPRSNVYTEQTTFPDDERVRSKSVRAARSGVDGQRIDLGETDPCWDKWWTDDRGSTLHGVDNYGNEVVIFEAPNSDEDWCWGVYDESGNLLEEGTSRTDNDARRWSTTAATAISEEDTWHESHAQLYSTAAFLQEVYNYDGDELLGFIEKPWSFRKEWREQLAYSKDLELDDI